MSNWKDRLSRYLISATAITTAMIGLSSPSSAFVNQIVIDQTATANFSPVPLGSSTPGAAVGYTIYYGRIFGTLNPSDPHNTIITDIGLGAPVGGSNSYIANFQIITPTSPAARSGLLINEVSNRGGSGISTGAMIAGATYVQNGWQGDLLSECSLVTPAAYPCFDLSTGPYGTMNTSTGAVTAPAPSAGPIVTGTTKLTPFVIQVPIATTDGTAPNGSNTITGVVYSHVAPGTGGPAASGGATAQLIIGNSPSVGGVFTPYQPVTTANNTGASLWSISSQTLGGVNTNKTAIANANWSWAYCPTGGAGTPSGTWICLPSGQLDPTLVYEITFPVSNPLVLGVGYAATRDFISFLRYGTNATNGGSNPLSGTTFTKAMTIGSSQSGAFIRGSIFYGFNQDESNRLIFDGAWPQIDGRMMWLNERWAQPTVLTQLYMGGEEAPVWWADFPNQARNLPANGLLHRCTATNSCPQILEHYGALEYYGEKMGADMTGYCSGGVCTQDIPLPSNVYRYFLPGTSHGGGAGGFNWAAPGTLTIPSGQSAPTSPVAETQTTNALQSAFIQLLMNGTPMPPSFGGPGGTFPTLASGQLVLNNQTAEGFPNIPGFPYGGAGAWTPMMYNFGPDVNYDQETGVPTLQPPTVVQLPEYVPHGNADGNSNGGSVPSVLFSAPLGTYVGWNTIAATPVTPYAGQQDSLTGGWWPFYDTKANRLAASDPRLSLEERYGSHTGYNCVARQAAYNSVQQRFLFAADATTLINQAAASTTILPAFTPTTADQGVVNTNCAFTTTHGFTSPAHSDILLRDSSGDVAIWTMNGTTISAGTGIGNVPNTWAIYGQHDYNGDGHADILWRDTSGNVAIWLMNGTTPIAQTFVANVPTNWNIVGTGDFNGDGKSDILWQDGSGNVAIWLMNGTTISSALVVANIPSNWTVVGTGDFNGDGMTDVLLRDSAGDVGIWLMNGTTLSSTGIVANVPGTWTVVGTGDFNSDGKSDILWRDSSGNVAIWTMNGLTLVSGAVVANVPTTWSIAQTGDFNGDGMSDILWRNTNGNVAIWLMNGSAIGTATTVTDLPSVWSIQSANAD